MLQKLRVSKQGLILSSNDEQNYVSTRRQENLDRRTEVVRGRTLQEFAELAISNSKQLGYSSCGNTLPYPIFN